MLPCEAGTFNDNTELVKHLGISKVTVSKYLNKKLVYINLYRFKAILRRE